MSFFNTKNTGVFFKRFNDVFLVKNNYSGYVFLRLSRNFSLVTCYKSRSLLVAEAACWKYSLVVKNHSVLVAKFDRYLLHKVTKKSELNLVMDDNK